MSIIKVDYGTIGGSGSVKYGTLTNIATNTEYTIDTGLSSITKVFCLFGHPTGSRAVGVMYDPTSTGKYLSWASSANNAETNNSTVASSYACTVMSVSGGTVVVKTPSNASYIPSEMYWYAE